jgi:hypothetical protein
MAGGLKSSGHFAQGETLARASAAAKQGDEIPAGENLLRGCRLFRRQGGDRLKVSVEGRVSIAAIMSGDNYS